MSALVRPKLVATVVLAAGALLLPLLAGCSKDEGRALPDPAPVETTTSTEPIDLTSVSLEPIAVAGKPTSTTRPLGGGKAVISGRVTDVDGNVVPGAFVRATYYGDPNKPEVIEALSAEDGSYRFEQVLGGRWRVRAWKTPELATLEDQVFFLGYTEQRTLDLKVKAATDLVVTSNIAPAPFIGTPVELAVLVLTQSVDEEGVVSRSPVGGAAVTLNVPVGWALVGDPTQATATNGRAAWQLTCTEVGQQRFTAIVGGREWNISVPPCRDPMETTTTTTTTTTLPPGASTSSTKPKPKVSSSTSSTRPPSYATTSTTPRRSGGR
ncbi:MAG TPA: carboxypeptidase-like regulatory domain-containing protein [Acidimicrobiia bacterium]|nr:carboxypeptidase-like regulatory domain-containing protein [Acidimicrobiia bacterium]